jgi:transcription factor STE12
LFSVQTADDLCRDNLFHITGTDIVRSLTYRFLAFGRPVVNNKKFEEGIFSDLRNLKPGTDASLEEPKSEFLDLLYKNNCIRTQKKQKVFYWFSVPHDRLFLDALERDLKREKMGQEPTTRATAEPAMSFYYDSSMTLYDQLTKAVQQSNSSANSLALGRARTHSISDYQATPLSRTHSRQVSEMMPPPPPQMAQMMSHSGDEFTYMMHDPHQLELEPPANIVPRQMDSSPYVPMPYGQHQYRNPAMSCPPFSLEYSPAPSFTGHVPDEYAQGRAMTYAPETPPQSQAGLYSLNGQMNYGFPTPESSVAGNDFTPHGTQLYDPTLSETAMAMNRTRGVMGVTADQMNVLQGSPTYKQRRRRTSISQQMALSGAPVPSLPNPAHSFGHRPRAASVADGSLRHSLLNQGVQRHTTPIRDGPYSRNATPVPSHLANPIFQANEELMKLQMDQDDRFESPMPMDMSRSSVTPGPGDRDSPAKTFTCPVPACGRLFKRLEHLKRHVRTHTQERPYVCSICSKKFSRSDNLAQYRPPSFDFC